MIHCLRRFIPVFIIGAAIVISSQISPSSVHAENTSSQAITLSPASTEVAIDPGNNVSKSVDIINSGSDAFDVTLSSSPYYVTGENYDPHFTQLPGTVDASEWVHLALTHSTVDAYKVLTITYTITVPKNTAPGGYYAVVFAETSTHDAKTGVVSHNRVGNILYITVNGSIKNGGSLTGNSLPPVSFAGSIPISTKISNSGGTHFITKATYSVTDLSGKEVFNASTERYILPQTEREISSSWSPGTVLGLFTVHRSATVAGTLKTLPDEKILIINPWIIAAFAFLIGIIIAILLQRSRRRRHTEEK